MKRGEIWWASLPEPTGAMPGYRRPVLIIQSNPFNDSRIQTVIIAILTTNMRLAAAPGNVQVSPEQSGLAKPSVVNVSQILTVDKAMLTEKIARLDSQKLRQLETGLRLVLAL